MLSLILANPRPADQPGTLALCPVSLLANWKTECDRVLPPSVAVLILNSANKGKTKPEDLGNWGRRPRTPPPPGGSTRRCPIAAPLS